MASGALTLLEASKGEPTQLKAGVIQTIIQESPIIEKLPWLPFEGAALQHEVEETMPDATFRDVNEAYTNSFGTTSFYFWGVAIMGGQVKLDNFLQRVMSSRSDQKAKQFASLAKSNAMRFDYEFFDGDGTNKGFKGVKTLIEDGFGQKLRNGAAGGGAALQVSKMDQARDLFKNQGDPSEILLNRDTRRNLTAYVRSTAVGITLLEIEKNTLGKRITMYDGMPLTLLGQVRNPSGLEVDALRFDQDDGAGGGGSTSTSMYFVKWGEDDVTGILGAGGSFDVVDFGEQQADPTQMGRLEWYPGIAVFNKYSIVRLSGITNAIATA